MRPILLALLVLTAACDNTIPKDLDDSPEVGGDTGTNTTDDADADDPDEDDMDGDGYNSDVDCDDTDENVNPGAAEDCATLDDDNCSGDANDLDALGCVDFFADADGDGYAGNNTACHCEPTAAHALTVFTDCDDEDATIFPGADEICDDIDNDCDDAIDDEDSSLTGTLTTFYIDSDGDSLGSATGTAEACITPDGYVDNFDDCDDGDAGTGAATDWYADADGDGFGDGYTSTLCMGHFGITELDGDCDDSDPDINPGEVDYCGDGIDHDCSGESDDWGPECIDLEPQDVLSMVSCTGSETGTAFTVAGDHITVRYGEHGMWWDIDTASGLQIQPYGTTGFKDVTYPGAHMDYLIVDMGTSSSSIGRFSWSMGGAVPSDYSVTCADSVRVGDVIGAIHSFRYSWTTFGISSNMTIRKTELWNEDGETMLVDFTIIPSMLLGTVTPRIQRVTDFDIDGISDDENHSVFDQTGSTGFVSNSGVVSDVTVGWGDCSSASSVGSFDGWFSSDTPTEDLCNPRSWTSDAMTIYDLESTAASTLAPAHHGYVLTIGNSPSEAESLWNDNAPDYCGELWEPGPSASFPGGMCNGTIIWEPIDPVDPSL